MCEIKQSGYQAHNLGDVGLNPLFVKNVLKTESKFKK